MPKRSILCTERLRADNSASRRFRFGKSRLVSLALWCGYQRPMLTSTSQRAVSSLAGYELRNQLFWLRTVCSQTVEKNGSVPRVRKIDWKSLNHINVVDVTFQDLCTAISIVYICIYIYYDIYKYIYIYIHILNIIQRCPASPNEGV